MHTAIICFTARGAGTAARIRSILEHEESSVRVWCKKKGFAGKDGVQPWEGSLSQWTRQGFAEDDSLIFVGAAGIAVRGIAPFLHSKTSDPAVLVVDELGKFVIPLCSGHIGGANALGERIARGLGATAVITTATDLNGRFAVDVFAKKHQLWIADMKLAKWISAELLDGHAVGFCSDVPWTGALPEGLIAYGEANTPDSEALSVCEAKNATDGEKGVPAPPLGICVSLDMRRCPFAQTLHLVPRVAALGLGCRRGKAPEELEAFVLDVLGKHGVSIQALEQVCSHEVKAREPAIQVFCRKYALPLHVFSADELRSVKGKFSSSAFVEAQVGVDNVCERSAVLGSGGGALLIEKTAGQGMTMALAIREWGISFE